MPYHYKESTHISQQNALALKSLQTTGELPSDHYWNVLRTQHDANVTKFDRTHNYVLAALLDRDQLQREGLLTASAPLLPQTGFFAYAVAKYDLNSARFDFWHPFLGGLFQITLPTTPTTAGEGLTTTPDTPTTPVVNPPGNGLPPSSGTGTGGGGGGPATPNVVPEPASVILTSLALIVTLVSVHLKRRSERAGVTRTTQPVGA